MAHQLREIEKTVHDFSLGFLNYFGIKSSSTAANQHDHSDGPAKGWHQRPTFHITGNGWINDPCAPGYDPKTKLYHLFYQCTSEGAVEWGNMSWGHVTSEDLVTWYAPEEDLALIPDQPYDKEGIFTGCFAPMGLKGQDGQLSVIYSSVKQLPFHWTDNPYPRNAAGLSVATSSDGGETWHKFSGNPILHGEPEGLAVSGFRDPYLAEWKSLDKLMGRVSLYGLVSGGISGHGGAIFLYRVSKHDLTKWNYLGPLFQQRDVVASSKKWSGDFGKNWECANFMTLRTEDGRYTREILTIGVEGSSDREHLIGNVRPEGLPTRSTGQALWVAASWDNIETLNKDTQKSVMVHEFSGVLDHGCWYAANSFIDPISGKRIVWGWIREEDISVTRCRSKEWTGYIGLPRELFLLAIPGVTRSLSTPISEIGNVTQVEPHDSTVTLLTMGIRPLGALSKLHSTSYHEESQLALPVNTKTPLHSFPINSSNWRLEATITLRDPSKCKEVGFAMRHEKELSSLTTISFSPSKEEITLDRTHSNTQSDIAKHMEKGAFTLFTTVQEDGTEVLEKLKFTIFCDGDVIEVFVNDRFALSSLVYVNQTTCDGISAFVSGEKECTLFEDVKIWGGLSAE